VTRSLGLILSIATVLGLTFGFGVTARAQSFTLWNGTFALCTVAPCAAIPGTSKEVACSCTVNNGYSVGQKPGQPIKTTAEGQEIRSRYYPIKSYVLCDNDRPWAWCLDKPCIISRNDPNAATCTCDAVKNLGPYIITTNTYTPTACTTGMISSATAKGNVQITAFLKKEGDKLPPFPVQILSPNKHD